MTLLPANCIDDRTPDTVLVSCSPLQQAVPHGMCDVWLCTAANHGRPIMVCSACDQKAGIYRSICRCYFCSGPEETAVKARRQVLGVTKNGHGLVSVDCQCANLRCDQGYVSCMLCLLRQAPQMLMLFDNRNISALLGLYFQLNVPVQGNQISVQTTDTHSNFELNELSCKT